MKYPVFDERVDLVNRDDLGHHPTQPARVYKVEVPQVECLVWVV